MKNNKEILIKKASGEVEVFLTEKLERSLRNAGAREETIKTIVEDICGWIVPGITTRRIYSQAFSLLQRERGNSHIRYRLKRAIYELGPTGYPFEVFMGKIFEKMGYTTEVGVVVEGKCIDHEMDVIATNEKEQHLAECKFHKDQGKHVSIQVPLYVRSRVDDIINKRKEIPKYKNLTFTGWVITNTRFSTDSISYGKCYGLKLLAWNYPEGDGLKEKIEKLKIYPITVLRKLTIRQKEELLKKEVVTCKQLKANLSFLKSLDLPQTKYHAVINELEDICG